MFSNLIKKWKQEWWENRANSLIIEYNEKYIDLEKKLNIKLTNIIDLFDQKKSEYDDRLDKLRKDVSFQEIELHKQLQILDLEKMKLKSNKEEMDKEEKKFISFAESRRHKIDEELSKLNIDNECKINDIKKSFSKRVEQYECDKKVIENKILLEKEEISHRLKLLKDRKIELENADSECKTQLRIMEAKANPSNIWSEAFTAGVSKMWDLMTPVMIENINKIKQTIRDEATEDAIRRISGGHNKKV